MDMKRNEALRILPDVMSPDNGTQDSTIRQSHHVASGARIWRDGMTHGQGQDPCAKRTKRGRARVGDSRRPGKAGRTG